MPLSPDARLYGILDLGYVERSAAIRIASQMLTGGVQILQLRAKNAPLDVIRDLATELVPLCAAADAPLIINDYPQIVVETGADGVHVGQDDISVAEARKIVGPDAIVGLSTHSLEQAIAAEAAQPDYIGYGPIFATATKPDYVPVGYQSITGVHERISLPIFCIGGVDVGNLPMILHMGGLRVCIVSGILRANSIVSYCRSCRNILAGEIDYFDP